MMWKASYSEPFYFLQVYHLTSLVSPIVFYDAGCLLRINSLDENKEEENHL